MFLRLFKIPLIKVSSYTFISTVVKMLTSFFTNKIIAILIGPSGLAIIGQFGNFTNILFSISNGGVTTGTTKFVAQYKNEVEYVKSYIVFTLQLSILISAIIGLGLIFFSHFVSLSILGDQKYSGIIAILGFTILFYSLNTSLLAIINGLGDFRKYILINIVNSLVGLIFTAILVYFWNLKGALISMVTYQSVVFIVTYLFAKNLKFFNWNDLFCETSRVVKTNLFQYTLMTLAGTMLFPIAQMVIRNHIMLNLSIDSAGIWEGINRISNIYMLLITSTLSVYYLPKLSALNNEKEVRKEIIDTLKLITPLLVITSLIAFIFRDFIIRVLFSSEFIPMRSLFLLQFTGNIIKAVGWILAYPMLAKKMTKQFIITEILYNGCWIIITIPLINAFGLQGAVMGYLVSYILYFFYILYIMRKILFGVIHEKS